MDDFVELSLVGGPCGVYLLLRGGEVVYVGQSVNVFARVASHWNNRRRVLQGKRIHATWQEIVIDFDAVRIKRCAERDLDREEFVLIQRYLPHRNVKLNRPKTALDEQVAALPCIRELVAKAAERKARSEIKRRRIA